MIYVDVDGVISDFRGWIRQIDPEFTAFDDDDLVHDIMLENIDTVYIGAEKLPAFDYFFERYREGGVKFLTAIGNFWPTADYKGKALRNKIKWLKNNGVTMKDIIIVDKAEEKIAFCQPGDVLYDDKPSTVKKWNQAGGFGFLVYDTLALDLGDW